MLFGRCAQVLINRVNVGLRGIERLISNLALKIHELALNR